MYFPSTSLQNPSPHLLKQKTGSMKKLLVTGLMLASIAAFAQKMDASKVPTSVKSTFNKNFPGTGDIKWEKENGHYEANFKKNGEKMAALFDEGGKWLETESHIEVSALPAAVNDYVAKKYKGEKIKGAAKIQLASGETNYEAEVGKKGLIFDADGKFIKEEKD